MLVFRKIDSAYSKLLTLIDAFTAFMVFVLMVLITADVVSRTLLNHPFQGVSEIVSNCIIILCFLEIPYVLMRGTHVRTTLIYDKVGHNGKCIIDIIAGIIGIVVFALIIQSSWGNFTKALAINDAEIAGSVRIPTVPGRFSVILGSALMVIEFIFQTIKNLIKLKHPDAFDDEKRPESAIPEGGNAI